MSIVFADKKLNLSKIVKEHASAKKNFEKSLNNILKEHSNAKNIFNKSLALNSKNSDDALN